MLTILLCFGVRPAWAIPFAMAFYLLVLLLLVEGDL
ncbi:hypothetical protein PRI8871_02957 [Pseudoprimorskyibacter insulae]|uniref:Uncharacterized protein n=1 Tax=Pseudoprimorskyibacter insulae TaxID=1695997 RepID=A0A2R8AYU8_9RHOB|nr:hypothetical protein PRI8871_02957 [Pseudoprimorskyibacter insulae]